MANDGRASDAPRRLASDGATIRDAQVEDLGAIVDIYNATIPARTSTADTAPVTVAQREAWFVAHSPQRRPLWVFQEGAEVIAWLSLSDFYGRPAYLATAEVGIYVREDQRGRGLARRLLEQAVEQAPALGLTNLLAVVFAHNQPSVGLFRACGFEQWGRLPRVGRFDDDLVDVLLLGRSV
jgi:L-amino acid N-acyltransferase YncA